MVNEIVFTIGEIARICQVNIAQVQAWRDNGTIRTTLFPQGLRVTRTALVACMEKHKIPLRQLEEYEQSHVTDS